MPMHSDGPVWRPDVDTLAQAGRDARLRRSIIRDWREAGYWPTQHLEGLRADGDGSLFRDWRQDETYCSASPRQFATWLAAQGMWEIESNVQKKSLQSGALAT